MPDAETPPERIERAEVIVCSPGRNFVTLKLTTGSGITGLGDAILNGRELAVASYLRDHLCPVLIGRDATRIEDTWQYLYRGAYWRRGPVTSPLGHPGQARRASRTPAAGRPQPRWGHRLWARQWPGRR